MAIALSIENVTSLYLYGGLEKSEDIRDRLRNPADSAEIDVVVDTASYMASVGRYALPAYSTIVQDMFSGNISRSLGVTDAFGITRLSIGDYAEITARQADLNFRVSQYIVDTSSADYEERAFIWGTTAFHINEAAILVWDSDGNLHIEDLLVEPLRVAGAADDNFDFVGGNEAINIINNNVLQPSIDPYEIGRAINFEFDNSSGNVISNYSQAAFDDDYADIQLLPSIPDVAGMGAAAVELLDSIITSDVVDYFYDGKFIVYGSAGGDTLSTASAVLPAHIGNIVGFGLAMVAGAGADFVSGGDLDDLIYGGTGNDQIYGGLGNDELFGDEDQDLLNGADGDDQLVGGVGADILIGGSGSDTVDYSSAAAGIRLVLGPTTIMGEVGGPINDSAGDELIEVERIIGTAFADRLASDGSGMTLIGGQGDDELYGKAGDTLIGGEGADSFYLTSELVDGGAGTVTIAELEAMDRIYVDGKLLSGSTVAALGRLNEWGGIDSEWYYGDVYDSVHETYSWLQGSAFAQNGKTGEEYYSFDLEYENGYIRLETGSYNDEGYRTSLSSGIDINIDKIFSGSGGIAYDYEVWMMNSPPSHPFGNDSFA